MIRHLVLGAAALLAMASTGTAGDFSPVRGGLVQYTGLFGPLPLLPVRFQNHCGWKWGHFYCANHCGSDYQFYYCHDASFGCCHVGYGYCDYHGLLRCRP
jgi:hypothetical protein